MSTTPMLMSKISSTSTPSTRVPVTKAKKYAATRHATRRRTATSMWLVIV